MSEEVKKKETSVEDVGCVLYELLGFCNSEFMNARAEQDYNMCHIKKLDTYLAGKIYAYDDVKGQIDIALERLGLKKKEIKGE